MCFLAWTPALLRRPWAPCRVRAARLEEAASRRTHRSGRAQPRGSGAAGETGREREGPCPRRQVTVTPAGTRVPTRHWRRLVLMLLGQEVS